MILDGHGEVLYGLSQGGMEIPSEMMLRAYYYSSLRRTLYYSVAYGREKLFIITYDIFSKEIPKIMDVLRETDFPIKNYLAAKRAVPPDLGAKGGFREFPERVRISQLASELKDWLESGQLYEVWLNTFEGDSMEYSHIMHQIVSKMGHPLMLFAWPGYNLCIAPVGALSGMIHQTRLLLTEEWRKYISYGKFIGRPYPASEIGCSYREALMVYFLFSRMGRGNVSAEYDQLGIYKLLLEREDEALEQCRNLLLPLMEYDEQHDGQLYTTLNCLLENDFNWKRTAERLYIHVNTLYFRGSKIEKCLGIDLKSASSCSELIVAYNLLHAYDRLNYFA